jgi:uncharacterized phage-associated protein
MEALGSIELRFDKRKALAASTVLLQQAGGRMPYMKLIKLVYAADRESLQRFGRPIVGGHYYAMKLGPVVSELLDLVKYAPETLGPVGEEWSQHFERVGYDIQLTRPADGDPLSEVELALLHDTWDLFARLDQFQLSELTHRLFREWSDPGGSARPISPEEILRALGKRAEEVEEARQDALERAHFDDLFG